MQFTVSLQGIITVGSALAVLVTIIKAYNKGYDMVKHQKEQDARIAQMEKGQDVILESLLGILNGQIEQGCNGATHAARDKLQTYLLAKGENHDQ